jgi:enhancing lycopene biosynthesis protein 2
VERVVEVEVPVTVVTEVDVEMLPKGSSWAKALTQLAEQLDRGLVYDRDLADLAQSMEAATEALNRRPWSRARRGT